MSSPLPIDALTPRIVEQLATGRNLVLEAPPGAGKTTRVPPALLPVVSGEILVLEPRRIAARMAARRIAREMGISVGEVVGYQVRFEDVSGPATRLRFLTEGLLTRRLLGDPELRGVSAVILDEFHERHLDTDLALALLRRLQTTSRPDLKLIVMSATLNTGPIAKYLDNCAILRSEGRLFDVEISYSPHSGAPLEDQVAAAAAAALQGPDGGDVLVFLPGAAEIRRAARACEPLVSKHDVSILPLHGSLSPEEQDRAVQPSDGRKLILSTNVAESSITIEGITAAIDSGLARIASDSPETGLPTLQVQRISKASALQRAGRAGRVRPGRAIRLYTAEDYHRRRDHDSPEIQRRELSQVVLSLRTLGATDVDWFEPPPEEALKAAADLLDRLTSHEKPHELAKYPLHPRLARLLVESRRHGVAAAASRVAALLTSGERYTHTDAIHLLDVDLPYSAKQIYNQLIRISGARRDHGNDDDLRIALLTAFPDRVARRRSATDAQLSSGRPALLPAGWQSDFLVAIDIEDRPENQAPIIRLACAIEPDWLLDLFPEHIREIQDLTWNRQAERVESVSRLTYDSMPIAETRGAPTDTEAAARLLADRVLDTGLQRFADPAVIDGLLARIEFASRHSQLPALTDEDVGAALADLCHGIRSFAELEKIAPEGLASAILRRLGPNAERTLNEIAPERIALKNRQVKVHYRASQQPYIASRLQDFFGLRATPRIARGQVPLLVHLLAPSQRPVQVTSDLAGFWEKLYPQVRRELSRKYPKHSWPERPH